MEDDPQNARPFVQGFVDDTGICKQRHTHTQKKSIDVSFIDYRMQALFVCTEYRLYSSSH